MKERPTPIRQQYLQIKRRYPQAIVLFRLGDFYETFDDDARLVSGELDIVLTSREMGKGQRVPLAGIPYHALDGYLARLVRKGHKVAICEQLTQPGEGRGLVEREVIRVVTPGTVVEPGLLDSKANNYLVSLVFDEPAVGIAFIDISTSEFSVAQIPLERLPPELERLKPSEIIVATNTPDFHAGAPVTRLDDRCFELESARSRLLEHFSTATLEGYGCAGLPLAIRAAGGIIHYLRETQKTALSQVNRLSTYTVDGFMALDEQTRHNLEIFRSFGGGIQGSLLGVIDFTRTPMGGRLLRRWLGRPLLDLAELSRRQAAIGWFVDRIMARNQAMALLGKIADLERIFNRVRSNAASPRELVALRRSLEIVPELAALVQDIEGQPWTRGLKPCPEAAGLIAGAIVDDPAAAPGEGGVIRAGFDSELDSLRTAARDARQYLADLERTEQERTGIKSLRVGYNRVFGYYIEVSKANLAQVPAAYIRKQTLTNGERFFTPELKEYESVVLNARDRLAELETAVFRRVCREVALYADPILALADALAHLDLTVSFAETAVRYSYVRPDLDYSVDLDIKQGRHPVVERSLPDFVPNDISLSEDARLIVLTGPNMAGKSTYLKQVALIVLLAQIGSFVPAASARIGIVDRIFTRIGAREDQAAGQSTFMVEMVETANILNNATPRSLLILDEIGRGTSTYDGLAIAQAAAEYIHSAPGLGCRTLFATHYHELVKLAGWLPRVKNFNLAVTEEGGEVVFLRKIVPGGVDRSYGIHVARLAGLPRPVVRRAQDVLAKLEAENSRAGRGKPPAQPPPPQLPLFGQKPAVIAELEKLDINSLTPLEALTLLYELQKKAKQSFNT